MPVPHGTKLPAPGTSSPILEVGAKEEKAVKESRKMFKEIGRVASKIRGLPGAIGAVGVGIESVMPFLETLAPLFQAFAPILTITNAMFTAFVGAITAELVPALQPLFIALIGMIPIFTELGFLIGQMIAMGLVPLINLFVPLITIFVSLLTIFLEFIGFEGFLTIMIVAVVTLGIALFALNAPFVIIVAIVAAVTTVIVFLVAIIRDNWIPIMEFISYIIGTYFINSIFQMALGIAFLIDTFTLGLAGAVDWVLTNVPSYQTGIDRVPATGLAMIHKDEKITAAGQVGLEASLLEEIRDLQREQLLEIKWRMR